MDSHFSSPDPQQDQPAIKPQPSLSLFTKAFCVAAPILLVLGYIGIAFVQFAILMAPANRFADMPTYVDRCEVKFERIGRAVFDYYREHDAFPPAYTVNAEGKPLHSWRTLLLPYLGDEAIGISRQIDLNRPWNDPSNQSALNRMPAVFRCPAAEIAANHTTCLAVVTPESCFQPTTGRKSAEVANARDVILLIEVDVVQSVPWMAPVDADERLLEQMWEGSPETAPIMRHVLMGNGRARLYSDDHLAENWRSMISINPETSTNEAKE